MSGVIFYCIFVKNVFWIMLQRSSWYAMIICACAKIETASYNWELFVSAWIFYYVLDWVWVSKTVQTFQACNLYSVFDLVVLLNAKVSLMNSRRGIQTSFVLGVQWLSIRMFLLMCTCMHAHKPLRTHTHAHTHIHTASQTQERIQGLDSARTPTHFNYNQTNLERHWSFLLLQAQKIIWIPI